MLTFTDEQRSALIKARQDWQAAEQARDELDRAKLPISSRSFDAVPSHGLPKGLDDRLTRVEALQAVLERAVGRAGESLCRADEALEAVEMTLPELKFFRAYYQHASSIEEAAQAAEITEQRALKLKSLVEFSAEEKPKTIRNQKVLKGGKSMNNLEIFQTPEFGTVRTVILEGTPWFVAADVCRILGLNQVSRAMDRLDDDERGSVKVTHPQSPDKVMTVNAVNESGLYFLILNSNKPEAKAFKRWITHEVIPAISKTGGYISCDETMTDEELLEKALTIAKQKIAERERRLEHGH